MSYLNPYSQINNSTSKAMFSFSKSNRPSMAKKLQQMLCDTFYQIPSTKSGRKASIGYGQKTTWDDLNKSKKEIPPPGSYTADDLFQKNKRQRKGYTAGIGRQVKKYYKKQTKSQSFVQFDKSVPGPQRYGLIEHQLEGPKYSMRPKTASQTFVRKSSLSTPGPGRYKPSNQMNPQGNYYISKWESSKAKRFDPRSSSRFAQIKTQAPGPGQYTPRNSIILADSRLTESRYVSNGNRVFAHGNRSTVFEQEPKKFRSIPGPGMYESFSEFGSPNNFSGKKNNHKERPVTSKVDKS